MRIWTMIAAATIGTAVACIPAMAQQKPPIKFAHTAALSGILAQTGLLQSIAVDLAISDINASGGINGSKVEMTHYDDQLKPDQAVLRVREAMAAGNVVIIGPISGTQWETVSPIANQMKFPAINVNANKPGINVRPWTLRMQVPDDTGMPEAMDDFLKHYPKVKKVAIMGDVREASGKAAVELWQDLAKAKGLQILDVVTYTTGTTDFSPTAIKIKELNPDAILISTITPDAIRLGREFKSQAIEVPILGNSLLWPGAIPQVLSKTIGKDADYWHVTGFSTNEESNGGPALYKSFVTRYIDQVMKDPTQAQYVPPNVANATLAYDGVMVAADILRKKGVDGNTPIDKAREMLKDGMVALKEFRGLNYSKFNDKGDAYIPMKALHIDSSKSEWQFLK
jgi:branched-chain amino acid transport system substrate-binding protein